MTRYKIILNPEAGRGSGRRSIPRVEKYLQGYGLDFDLVCTKAPWHAAELAQAAVEEGYHVVVAAGGDGTANEVLNGLMHAKECGASASMGVLPIGQGNDFSFGMGIPLELEASCQTLADDHRRTIDVGHIKGGTRPDGRYFGNGAGIGFDTIVGFEALKLKRLHGFPAYFVAAVKTIFLYYQAPTVRLDLDEETFTLPSLMVSIMNGRRMGGGFMMAPHGDPEDGFFDLCIAGEVSRLRLFPLIPRFLAGTQGSHPEVQFQHAKRVTVTALTGGLPTHVDGETVSTDGTELALELLPRQLELITRPS